MPTTTEYALMSAWVNSPMDAPENTGSGGLGIDGTGGQPVANFIATGWSI